MLRKRINYTEEEIEEFQVSVDTWYSEWVKVFGEETCTNYIHELSSGHVREQMIQYKCLYRFSQEGLEAMNALIKSYFFRRTNRGGGKSLTKNRVEAIGRWLHQKGDFSL